MMLLKQRMIWEYSTNHIAFNKVYLRDQSKSGKAVYQIPTGGSLAPCIRIIYRTTYCAVFLLSAPVHARRSFLGIQVEHF